MYGMVKKVDVIDVVKLIIISIVPPVGLFLGAAMANHTLDEIFHAATPQEAVDKVVLLYYIWALIPTPQIVIAYFAIRFAKHGEICSRLARRIAPWLLGAGFVASFLSIPLYDRFLSYVSDGWREATVFTYFTPMILTYSAMFGHLILRRN
jgi:hypothetical protein